MTRAQRARVRISRKWMRRTINNIWRPRSISSNSYHTSNNPAPPTSAAPTRNPSQRKSWHWVESKNLLICRWRRRRRGTHPWCSQVIRRRKRRVEEAAMRRVRSPGVWGPRLSRSSGRRWREIEILIRIIPKTMRRWKKVRKCLYTIMNKYNSKYRCPETSSRPLIDPKAKWLARTTSLINLIKAQIQLLQSKLKPRSAHTLKFRASTVRMASVVFRKK